MRPGNAWSNPAGRDLDPLPIEPGNWNRVVACLNIWNDLTELQANIDTWYPHVDHVIAVDGAYAGMGVDAPQSTDGTLEYLRTLDKVEIIEARDFWADQCVKRSEYFKRARPGDLLFIVDADETIAGAETLRTLPRLDVGWLRYTAPIYRREAGQPRAFAYRDGLHYESRHHHIHDAAGRLICTHQRGGPGLLHRLIPLRLANSRGSKRDADRVQLGKLQRSEQFQREQEAVPLRTRGHEPLRVVQLGSIDPGIVVARLHSAINTTTPHGSVMAITNQQFTDSPRQYDLSKHLKAVSLAAAVADVLHLHVNYDPMRRINVSKSRWRGRIVIHHHGTMFRKHLERFATLDREATIRLVSNLELTQYAPDLVYLPNPVPVARYSALGALHRPPWQAGTLRIAHSPSKRENKGTDLFIQACERLKSHGLAIEPVLIERLPWREALAIKATCHATFDSFWLGMQCSGIEAAAMGQPVIAGDADCQREYLARYGAVPYTWANDEPALREAIERLATDHLFYCTEAARVGTFVEANHDYAQVAATYLDLLDGVMSWRDRLTIGKKGIAA